MSQENPIIPRETVMVNPVNDRWPTGAIIEDIEDQLVRIKNSLAETGLDLSDSVRGDLVKAATALEKIADAQDEEIRNAINDPAKEAGWDPRDYLPAGVFEGREL